MQPLGVGGVDVRDFEVKNCYESSGRDWSARSALIGGERVCLKRMRCYIDEVFEKNGGRGSIRLSCSTLVGASAVHISPIVASSA
ncbi:hypothetical protein TNCV_4156961 [Trichonephila clavipes]|nr:hypothetical protein TNCV_4156961 [Trichonephila clavipes]